MLESSVGVVVLLFALAAAVAIAARWLRFPYAVGLVAAGLGLGALRWAPTLHLTKDLLFAVFLPGLVFEAAFHLEARRLLAVKWGVGLLAVPGVALGIVLTTLALKGFFGLGHFSEVALSWGGAAVFAALIAATDPIAVIGIFKNLRVPHALATLIEGESLLNDGTAVVFFGLILDVVTGASGSVGDAALGFVRVVGLGALIGGGVGLAASAVIRRVDDAMIEITVTTIAAYGSFAGAELAHGSGVIATVVAGILCGSYAAKVGMSPTTRLSVEAFWEYVAFALNSVVFLLIGASVSLSSLWAVGGAVLVAWLAVTLGRGLAVITVALGLRHTRERMPRRWSLVLTWGGLRGGLSMVLALALPASFPARELLVSLTFGAVVLSILVQGLTIGPLLRKLGLGRGEGDGGSSDPREARRLVLLAARDALVRAAREDALSAEAVAEVRAEVDRRLAEVSFSSD